MKLIIQIPCHNEERTLPATLVDLPRTVRGFDSVEWLVIDDGSRDRTAEAARAGGVDHVVRFSRNRGLARAFEAGIAACLARGADVIVNTDADNQYDASCIPDLVEPILRGEADIVVGCRPIESIAHFSWLKKRLQRLGSWLMRRVTGGDVTDAVSGFRALSREAALHVVVTSDYTYTLETLVAATHQRFKVAAVNVRTNRMLRPSRLIGSMWRYLGRQLVTLMRVYSMYRPLRVFLTTGSLAIAGGLALIVRYLILKYVYGEGKGHVQSVVAAGLLLNVGALLVMMGVMADVIRANRLYLERLIYRVRRLEFDEPAATGDSSVPRPPDSNPEPTE